MRATQDVVIANGASLSGAAPLRGYTLCGLIVPSAWTAADITFAAAVSNGRSDFDPATATYYPVYDSSGTELTIVNGSNTSRFIALSPTAFAGVSFLKVRSGTNAAAVNQGAARTITLALKVIQ